MLKLLRQWRERRYADARRRILSAIAHGEASGQIIEKRSGVSIMALYPILMRLEGEGVLTSRWETDCRNARRDPRRRLYRAVKPDCGPWG